MLLFGCLGVNMKRCSVSLSFVDEEVYDVTSYDVTSNDVSVERHSDFELASSQKQFKIGLKLGSLVKQGNAALNLSSLYSRPILLYFKFISYTRHQFTSLLPWWEARVHTYVSIIPVNNTLVDVQWLADHLIIVVSSFPQLVALIWVKRSNPKPFWLRKYPNL